jgi:hypothetical protein
MTKLTIRVLIGALMVGVTGAAATTLVAAYHTPSPSPYTRVDYANAERLAGSEYRAARARCEAIERRQRDVCVAEAHAAERSARAEAENQFRGTSKSRYDAHVAATEAE